MKFVQTAVSMSACLFISVSAAAAPVCNAASTKVLANSCQKKDHTGAISKAVARCSATIKAPKGYFFFRKDVKLLYTSTSEGLPKGGAKEPIEDQTAEFVKHKKIPKQFKSNPLIAGSVLSSATAKAYCDRPAGSRIRKTCYARAKISVKAYPFSCLKKWTGG